MLTSAFLETLWQDLRFGARALVRSPGFAAIAILTLALGIGANAAIFSVLNAVLLRPLPWAEPDRAVMIWSKWTAFDKTWVAEGEVVDYRKRSQTLQEVATWSEGQVNLTGDQEPERVAGARVSANTFSTLGVAPLVGRTFTAQEDLPNGPRLVVLGHGLWKRRYSSDASLIGRSILINGNSFEVVGVMPQGFVLPTDFRNPEPTQLWTPLQMNPADTNHGSHGLYAAGRLKPGATVRQAADELHGIARAMTSEGPLSGPDAVRHGRALARRRGRRFGAPVDLAAFWCRRIPAAHRLRQCRQPAARARGSAPARDGGPRGAWRQRLESAAPAAHREPGADGSQRRRWPEPGLRRRTVRGLVEPGRHPAPRRCRARRVRPDLHGRRGVAHERAVQPRARRPCAANRSDRLPQGRRPERLERRSSPAVPERAGRRADGAGGIAARRRGPDAPQPLVAPANSHRLRSVERADDESVVAGGELCESRNRSSGSTRG